MHTSDQNEIVRQPIDEAWTWSEEDMKDFTRASMIHAEESIPGLLEME